MIKKFYVIQDSKMRLIHLILLMILIISCSEKSIEIKTSNAENININDAYIRTTKIEVDGEEKAAVGTKTSPALKIIFPNDGNLIKSSNVSIELDANNFNIVPIDMPVKDDEGHFHVWLDSEKKVSADKTFTFENVVSGKHTIVAELVKSDHSSLSPKVIHLITINVESAFVPKIEEQQAGIKEFTVEADDNGFYPSTLKAKIGDKVKINFKFRDNVIYFAGLDVKGPFEDINYKLKGEQPVIREFTMKDETKITSYWPASGVKKGILIVEIEK